MPENELIQENNEKRKLLNAENLKYYEDMLIYIRLSFDKSEAETEELLMDMLDHLLDAQAEGKTAVEVFGDNPKQYAHDLVKELPKMVTKKRVMFFLMGAFYFIAAGLIVNSLFDVIGYFAFNYGSLTSLYFFESSLVKSVIAIILAFITVLVMIKVLRWTCFKNFSYWKEFFYIWLVFMPFGLVITAAYIFMPDFGHTFNLSAFYVLFIGLLTGYLGWRIYKSI